MHRLGLCIAPEFDAIVILIIGPARSFGLKIVQRHGGSIAVFTREILTFAGSLELPQSARRKLVIAGQNFALTCHAAAKTMGLLGWRRRSG